MLTLLLPMRASLLLDILSLLEEFFAYVENRFFSPSSFRKRTPLTVEDDVAM